MSFLTLRGLEKRYGDGFLAVKGIDLAVTEGEFIVLLGPSGCGKTTTLRCVAGLELATGGSIHLDGADVTSLRPAKRDVGMVFQFYALYPHLSVRENLLFPLKSVGMARAEREARVAEVAAALGLTALLDRSPRQLPGGDQQRVSLGRAMIRRPRLWLMDEPLGTIDGEARERLRDFVRTQQVAHGITTLYVTHDQEEAMTLADRVVVMREGRILQVGTPAEIYESPQDLFVADFVGSPGMNRLRGRANGGVFQAEGGGIVSLPAGVADGEVVLGVRGEYVLPRADGPLAGTVVLDEYLGAWRNLHLDSPCGRIVLRRPPEVRHAPGTTVRFGFANDHVLVFHPDGRRLA